MTNRPRYAPWMEAGTGFRIGLRLLDADSWIEPDDQAEAQFANKRRLLCERPSEVLAALPESEAAQDELLVLLAAYLMRQFPQLYEREGTLMRRREFGDAVDLKDGGLAAIDRAGRLVQEDLCLMQAGPGGHVLTAASLCAPSSWRLADKIGKAMSGIHEPVPGFEGMFQQRVERIFTSLRPDAPVWRTNWSIMAEPTLFLAGAHDRSPQRLAGLLAQTAGDRLFIRVERQTLRRLPETGAIVFTIKTHIDPLRVIGEQPELMQGMKHAIAAMPEEMAAYKALGPIRDALTGWLDWCLRVY